MSVIMVVLVVWSIRALESKLSEDSEVSSSNSLAVLGRSRRRFLAYLNGLFRPRAPLAVTQGSIQMSDLRAGRV